MTRLKHVVTFAVFSLLFGSKIAQTAISYDATTKVDLSFDNADDGDDTY